MSELMRRYSLLTGINSETVEIIARKVSLQRLNEYSKQDFDVVKTMEKYGIEFQYDTKGVFQLFQSLYQVWIVTDNSRCKKCNQCSKICSMGLDVLSMV